MPNGGKLDGRWDACSPVNLGRAESRPQLLQVTVGRKLSAKAILETKPHMCPVQRGRLINHAGSIPTVRKTQLRSCVLIPFMKLPKGIHLQVRDIT